MAEVVAGLLTPAVVKIAGDKLSSAIAEQANLLWSFRGDLEDMRTKLETMKAAFADAERRSIKDELVRLWMKRLKDAALDISDMMDEYRDPDETQASAKKPGMLSCLPITRKKIALANKMKNMRQNLSKINEDYRSFNFISNTDASLEQLHYDQRETTSKDNTEILGRDVEKKAIMDLLSASENRKETIIVPIYGLGAMGKTTLARLVYNDTQFKMYDHRVWVYVSQVFDLKKIGRAIISQLPRVDGQSNSDSLESIYMNIDKLFSGKKILIVLDDIWEERKTELDKLKTMLDVRRMGSMIDVIVTTRKENIANKICTNNEPYKLQPLNDGVCWDIIKRSSDFERKANQEQLGKIGLDIAKKCGGVALAAQALGYMLKSKDLVDDWSKMKNSEIWNNSFDDDENERVLPSLMLSYERMTPNLRLCFSYCAIFPKGHHIVKDDLIHQWDALDFIEPSKGKEYIKQLLGMSFLQKSHIGDQMPLEGHTMHDLVHDLARSVIGDELVVLDRAKKTNTSEYCRYALLRDYDGKTNLSEILPKKVRALHFVGSSKLSLCAFTSAKRLRILDFSRCSGILFPISFDQPKQLRRLVAPSIQNDRLPECISELSKLQYLNLNNSFQISALPESIGKLVSLIYLDLSNCFRISELPESFGCLKKLLHLDMSGCSGITKLPASLGDLTNLEHLNMSHCSKITELPSSIGNLTELRRLQLSWCLLVKEIPESSCGLIKLQCLNLSYCQDLKRLPEDIGNLINLQYFSMSNCRRITELPKSFQKLRNLLHLDFLLCPFEKGLSGALRGLTTLRHLNMSGMYTSILDKDDLPDVMRKFNNLIYLNLSSGSLKNLFCDSCIDFIDTLTSLEHLDLSNNKELVSLPESIGNLQRLRTLNLSRCAGLKSLPESISALSLKSLFIEGCSGELIDEANSRLHFSLMLPLFRVRADDANAFSNLHLLKGVNARVLQIHSLENVRSLEEAHHIMLLDKQTLSDLTLAWASDACRVLEDKDLLEALIPPRGLKHLKLEGYSSRTFPIWLGLSDHLPNLVCIELNNLPTCTILPPLGQLPNLEVLSLDCLDSITKIDKDFCGGREAFCRLFRFNMRRMRGLEEWTTTYSGEDCVENFMFPVLEELEIDDCPKLRLKPRPPKFTRQCVIDHSEQVISSLEEMADNVSHLSSSTGRSRLFIQTSDCSNLRLFNLFPTLDYLGIIECRSLTSLPDGVRQLTSLEMLNLRRCESISTLPEWLGELSCLTRIIISKCEGIKSFPPCIQQLTKLRRLNIQCNPGLKQWCESEENKMKLAHIEEIEFEDCD